ncbi:DNA-3-methyladenine glycosylase I [Lutimaribacter sp. EGI FJ00015]|uniref:DNA-3-methyladenine glycosylase I n=1 Tax=Lutimaribacter degradans TaxID=2945989 RepID=A0ACC5ZVX1_9RHOB|nr:DNA-3-methyladenine glycosylase I [Lutimaribacter sp. EGI FJ00013]MCO0612750.1 DNA-3-methyladenine glycosylase I [Lutimaribacter sp. EGI FJ00015]MCO0635408.1 DNA-3-methyladenine glycosylase I [Lutimaribacter sp. EGI FJ00014]
MNERCGWVSDDPLYIAYHDDEWGVPVRDSRVLFEMLVLESFQSGLNWLTILRKRAGFRQAFHGFDPEAVARFTEDDVTRLLGEPAIVRHRGKIEATIANARAWCALNAEIGFAGHIWGYVGGTALQPDRASLDEVPAQTELSREISRDLKTRGFRFVGPTTVYAFMQAAGLVNDHVVTCPCHARLRG